MSTAGFGGYRESGVGREGGREGLMEYLRPAWQTPWLWRYTLAAQLTVFAQVTVGVVLMNVEDLDPPQRLLRKRIVPRNHTKTVLPKHVRERPIPAVRRVEVPVCGVDGHTRAPRHGVLWFPDPRLEPEIRNLLPGRHGGQTQGCDKEAHRHSPTAMTLPGVRKYSTPSEIAGVAIRISSREFVANTRNVSPASSTDTSPSSSAK